MTGRSGVFTYPADAEEFLLPVRPIDLQLFAAEDEGKTEQATPKRLREARRKGRVPKTPELAASLTLLTGAIYLSFTAKRIFGDIRILMQKLIEASGQPSFEISSIGRIMGLSGSVIVRNVLPLMVTVFVVAALAELLQVGFHFSVEPLKPSFDKISFTWEKLKKKVLLSRPVAVGLVKAFLKLAVIGLIAFLVISGSFRTLMSLVEQTPAKSLVYIASGAFRLLIWVAVFFIILAVLDFFYQKYEFKESQKMTRHEVKREFIEDEGHPLYKKRLRDMFQNIQKQRKMLEEVPKADVVVTNPTHYAVALLYEEGGMKAPRVLAKGEDLLALKIREIARANSVPLTEDRWLARSLYDQTQIGEEIPAALYQAVALVFRHVYELKSKKAS